jgi:hypothetical protein
LEPPELPPEEPPEEEEPPESAAKQYFLKIVINTLLNVMIKQSHETIAKIPESPEIQRPMPLTQLQI